MPTAVLYQLWRDNTVHVPTNPKNVIIPWDRYKERGGIDRNERRVDVLVVKPDEAAAMLRCGKSIIYKMMASGDLPVIRVGADRRIPVDALRHWVATQISREDAPCKTA